MKMFRIFNNFHIIYTSKIEIFHRYAYLGSRTFKQLVKHVVYFDGERHIRPIQPIGSTERMTPMN